jgi:hypothetical protein
MRFSSRLAGLLLVTLLFGRNASAAGETQHSVSLTSTGSIPSAAGTATITEKQTSKGVDRSLVVDVSGLGGLTVYVVKVDGKLAGALNTDPTGAARLELSTNPKRCENSLPSTINLSTAKLIEVSDETGSVVLVGSF